VKSILFWGITPCSPFKVNRRSGGTYRLHIQGEQQAKQETSEKVDSEQRHVCVEHPGKTAVTEHSIYLLCSPPAFTLVSCSTYSSTLKMEAICSSETSVNFERTTRHYTPEGSTFHNHHYENLKSTLLVCSCLHYSN
jgi:hypothetical protein